MQSISLGRQLLANDGTLQLANRNGPTVRLLAVGDLAFHGEALVAMRRETPQYLFDAVGEGIRSADLAIGNLESVLVAAPFSPLSGKACLVSGLDALEGLRVAGFDVLTFANNHILDAGTDGLVECLDGLDAAAFPTAGAGRNAAEARVPVSYRAGGFCFRIHAYSYGQGQIAGPCQPGCNEARLSDILRDLRDFKEPGDIPIVCLHMDAEFQSTPAPDRVRICRKIAEAGVPIVLCHHPHVPQGLEFHHGSLIAYSLGNYVFPMIPYMRENSNECTQSFQLEIEVGAEGPVNAVVVPVTIDGEGRPVPAVGSERLRILQLIAERSLLLEDPDEVAARYRAMISQYTRQMAKNLYWSIGERNWGAVRNLLGDLMKSPTKQSWIRHYLSGWIQSP